MRKYTKAEQKIFRDYAKKPDHKIQWKPGEHPHIEWRDWNSDYVENLDFSNNPEHWNEYRVVKIIEEVVYE